MTDWLSTLCDRGTWQLSLISIVADGLAGGPLALLSLNGLYILMTSYNL